MKSALTLFLFLLFLTGVFGDDVESVSVMEGDSVTLNTGTIIQSNEIFEWKFKDAIARINKGSSKTAVTVPTDGAFKDRLQLDNQTGALKIIMLRTTDSGPFKLDISRTEESSSKTFNLIVSAAPVKTVSVMVGDSVTLHTGVPEPHRYDVIQWRFKNSLIAEISRTIGKLFTSKTDERFKDRLQLDYWTGSLTIRNTENKHSGDYEVDIISSHLTIHKSFTVTVSGVTGEMKSIPSVSVGESVTLISSLTEIQTDNLVWMLRDSQIAGMSKAGDPFYTSGDRLKLDNQTGSLTITDTTNTHSGEYTLQISSSRCTILRRFTVSVIDPPLSAGAIAAISVGGVVGVLLGCAALAGVVFYYHRWRISELVDWIYEKKILSLMENESITLTPDEEDKDHKLQWIFRGSCIAERESAAHNFTTHDHLPDERFEGRLKLDNKTGSLKIPKTKPTDSGLYELLITKSGKSSIKRFSVSVFVHTADIKTMSVEMGKPVKLETGVDDLQIAEHIQWKFGLTPLAKIKNGEKKISPFVKKIFQGKVDLDRKTGSLIIEKIRPTDAGIYMLYKIEEGNLKTKLFRVSVSDPTDNRNNPEEESVRINNPEEVPLNSVDVPDSRL